MKRKYGFTLVEVLISTAILSIVILSIYSAFQTGVLSYRKIDSASRVYQTARIIFNRLALDLKNAFAYTQQDSGFKGDNKSIEFFTVIDLFDKEGNLHPVFCRIRYEWADGVLKRFFYCGIDALEEGFYSEGEVVSSDIEEINFQYATAKEDNPWQESWPEGNGAEQKKTLPSAVKIKLNSFWGTFFPLGTLPKGTP